MTLRRTPSRSLLALTGAVLLTVGVTACGGSDRAIGNLPTTAAPSGDTSAPDATLPAGVTLPAGITVPGVSADCAKLYGQFVQAMSGAMTGQSTDAGKMFDAMKKVLPAELQSAAQTMSEAYSGLTNLMTKYNGDYAKAAADPAFQAAIQAMSSEKVTAASAAITNYFDTKCPN